MYIALKKLIKLVELNYIYLFSLFTSLAIHTLIFNKLNNSNLLKVSEEQKKNVIKISFLKEEKQIVEIDNKIQDLDNKEIKETRFITDKETHTDKETKRKITESTNLKNKTFNLNIKIDSNFADEVLNEGNSVSSQHKEIEEYIPFQLNNYDFLPDIKEGEITLLNTKAERNTVFVKRVASRVFNMLRLNSWKDLSFTEVLKAKNAVIMEAILDSDGSLKDIKIIDKSKSIGFDKALEQAIDRSCNDPNVPNQAKAEDGKVHFIFLARTWVVKSSNSVQEKRWILLATGLK